VSKRFFKHGELPLLLLALVASHPRHGYEIMNELTRLFAPRYRPSPGSIYPAIEALQTEGLISGRAEGEKTIYSVTDLGRDALDDRAEQLAAIELRLGVQLGGRDSLDAQLVRFKARLVPLAGKVEPEAAAEILDRAAVEIEQLNSTRTRKQRSTT
jgi:DNA-binding PadR family transcriptional regulator